MTAFSLALGAIALYEPLVRRPDLRSWSILLQSIAVGGVMALLLEVLGNEDSVTFANWFMYSGCAFGILMGVMEGQIRGMALWERWKQPPPPPRDPVTG